MFQALIITGGNEGTRELGIKLSEVGFTCLFASDSEEATEIISEPTLNIVLLVASSSSSNGEINHLVQEIKEQRNLPVIALFSRESLNTLYSTRLINDFAVEPWEATEVAYRAKRALCQANGMDNDELIKCAGLMINLAKCEVTVEGGKVELTFKEYELLKFLASNRGRVYTREVLLNKVWGYDYYGGDRTVDVHIRRLRSKLEDAKHTFIETVRNIGYRFKDNNKQHLLT